MFRDFDQSLELFLGDASPAQTRVYARLASETSLAGLKLSGTLEGPYCRYAQTLPATVPLQDSGAGETLLAQAVVPDPCFWTPELPFLYRATVELRRGRDVLATADWMFGMRPLGCRGRRFYYEGKPWVLRGVQRREVSQNDLMELHRVDAALFVENPDDELCDAASEQGVLMIADLAGDVATAAGNIRRLARHASVGFVVLDDTELAQQASVAAPNVVCVARRMASPAGSFRQLAMLYELSEGSDPRQMVELTGGANLPIIAYRPAAESGSIADHRRLCDHLQRDLAGTEGIAGYLV